MKKLTEKQIIALKILRETPNIRAAGFAKKMWPDSHMHVKHSNGGHGCQVGKAGWLCGGSYLAKLVKKGWVYDDFRARTYRLTRQGEGALKNTEE